MKRALAMIVVAICLAGAGWTAWQLYQPYSGYTERESWKSFREPGLWRLLTCSHRVASLRTNGHFSSVAGLGVRATAI